MRAVAVREARFVTAGCSTPPSPPPKSAIKSAVRVAWDSVRACAQRIKVAASAVTVTMMTAMGPNRSVNDPQMGLEQMPTSATRESKSVAKSVENPRTLCR
jgi:hypothetical protein